MCGGSWEALSLPSDVSLYSAAYLWRTESELEETNL